MAQLEGLPDPCVAIKCEEVMRKPENETLLPDCGNEVSKKEMTSLKPVSSKFTYRRRNLGGKFFRSGRYGLKSRTVFNGSSIVKFPNGRSVVKDDGNAFPSSSKEERWSKHGKFKGSSTHKEPSHVSQQEVKAGLKFLNNMSAKSSKTKAILQGLKSKKIEKRQTGRETVINRKLSLKEKPQLNKENKDGLGGVVFMCSEKSKPDCFHYTVMSLPADCFTLKFCKFCSEVILLFLNLPYLF